MNLLIDDTKKLKIIKLTVGDNYQVWIASKDLPINNMYGVLINKLLDSALPLNVKYTALKKLT